MRLSPRASPSCCHPFRCRGVRPLRTDASALDPFDYGSLPPMTTFITRPSTPSPPLSFANNRLSRDTKPWSRFHAARTSRVSDGPPTFSREPRTRCSSAHALAMLTRQPMFVASLPRFHVKPRGVDGSLLVVNRASDEQFTVYTPRFIPQFRSGHRSGRWYLRPVGDLELSPRSSSYLTAHDAVEAIRSGHWRPSPSPVDRRRPRFRVLWS